jgi:L-rhamnose mutarotase
MSTASKLFVVQRICFLLQIRPDKLAEYEERHRAVWPEMQEALRETGWRNYSLFLRPDGLLVGYLETEDFEAAKRGMAEKEVNTRWQREMAEYFVDPEGVAKGSAFGPLKQVFHLDQ